MEIVPTDEGQRKQDHRETAAADTTPSKQGHPGSSDTAEDPGLTDPSDSCTDACSASESDEHSDDGDPGTECEEGEPFDGESVPDVAEFDPRDSVMAWEIRAVGRRPKDYLARDCLFASLFRDPRVTWFHRYVRRPSEWMAALVRKLPDPAEQKQALCLVALHYLHKKHLARLLPLALVKAENDDDERDFRILSRLWNCPPHGALLGRYRGDGPAPRVCALAWGCPWCHARKVVALYQRLRQGPLKAPKAKYLLYGKAAPFGEPMGGIDGEYTADDYYEYYHGPKVRGHWGRYYGRHPQRVRSTRQARVAELLEEARPFLPGGLWTHQLSSHQAQSGQRTFRHDLAVFGLTDREDFGELNSDSYVRWLPLPAAHPQALRAVLAGSSLSYPAQAFGLPEESAQTWNGSPFGIEGALGWQPTFLLDDRVWGAYVSATRNQRLYHAFGDWKGHLGDGARAKRESTPDRQFARAQAARHAQKKQQRGNRQRQRQAEERRQKLLAVARPLWEQVQAEPHHGRGRPPHRSQLEQLLTSQGISLGRGDRDWLMKALRRDRR